jgi:hypothetical protein
MVGNDPINYCDLLGLTPETDLFAAIARGSAADIETVLSVYAEVLQPSAVAQGQAALARIAANEARKIACAEVLRRAFKKKRSGLSGKAASSDKPSWVKEGPRVGEKGEDFATRLLDEKYGQGGWTRGGRTEFSQIQKWADRAFE